MGLLLSTLVFCVGVVELITFYHNVRRHVEYSQAHSNLSTIRSGYIQELRNTRRKLIEDLERLKEPSQDIISHENRYSVHNIGNNRAIPTFRLNSHEDIEIEYNENIVRSKSSSPRRFLVTEKEEHDSIDTRRCFVVSEEPQAMRRAKSQSSLPEFLIREEKNSVKSPNNPRYVLQEQQGTGEHPIPLPRQFIVSETELNTIVFQDPDIVHTRKNTEYVRRSPSPFPTQELPQNHRNSLCSELFDCLSLGSVQEELKSRSPSPNTVIENVLYAPSFIGDNNNITPDETERRRSKSESECHIPTDAKPRSSSFSMKSSSNNTQSKIEHDIEEALKETVSEDFETTRFNRKNVSNNKIDKYVNLNEEDAMKLLENPGTSSNTVSEIEEKKKQPEAFWVKSVE